jgi:hypothetical protein
MLAVLFSILLSSAQAGELAGVKVPDSVDIGGKTAVLNGMGVRTKYYVIKVYVGSAYLPEKTHSAKQAIDVDAPKRIQMDFIYSAVPRDKQIEAIDEDLAHDPAGAAKLKTEWDTLKSYYADMTTGDKVVYDYVPGTGVTVTVKGQKKGTIAGAEFMKALWSVYFGAHPPTEDLKSGMLGN